VKTLHISTRLIVGGSQENTILSCEEQSRRGHEVHLAFGPIYGPEGSMLDRVAAFEHAGKHISAHEIPDMVRQVNPIRDWRATKQLRALIREIKPDIVHTHSSKAGVIGRAAAWKEGGRARKLGVVHTVHGPSFHALLPAWKNAMYILSERFAARKCHAVISVADAMTEQYVRASIGTAALYTTVRSGMETERFLNAHEHRQAVRERLGIPDDAFVLGTVSRLAEHKGHDHILDALGESLRDRSDAVLLWVGDGWWRDRLLDKTRAMGLADRIVLTGLVPPEQVAEHIGAMDALIHPSEREGLPRAVVQALLAGVPVIAHDVDGTREVCIDGVTGRLVPAGDHDVLREAVLWTMDQYDAALALAAEGRTRCAEAFSVRAMVDGLDEVYARVCNAAR